MARYSAYVTIKPMQEQGIYNSGGCAQYSIFNAGNVNVTIDGIHVLEPRQTWVGPDMHPEVAYFSKHKIEFDEANAPTILTPVGGTNPPPFTINPGDPPPARDRRVLIFETFLK